MAFDSLVTLPNPTSVALTALHEGAAPLVPFPVCDKKFLVTLVFGLNKLVVSRALWYPIAPNNVVALPPAKFVLFVALVAVAALPSMLVPVSV